VLLALSINQVCIPFEPLGRYSHGSWQGDNAIQADLDAIIFIHIVSTVLKWLRFEFQMKLK
jgi:hypothetical protein